MKIVLLSVGKSNDKLYSDAIEEFNKRIQKYYSTEWHFLQIKNTTKPKDADIKKAEALLVLSFISKNDYIILLDERGKMLSSIQLAEYVQQRANESVKRLVFLIGGAYGVDHILQQRANFIWSLSALVFPHQLVRLILIEQLYRACTIQRNENYHHA